MLKHRIEIQLTFFGSLFQFRLPLYEDSIESGLPSKNLHFVHSKINLPQIKTILAFSMPFGSLFDFLNASPEKQHFIQCDSF